MLVLSRRIGEQIVLPQYGVTITLLSGSGPVRLGVDAPPDISIFRSELLTDPSKSRPAGKALRPDPPTKDVS